MRVLVVEDDPRMASVLRRGLCEDGFAVDVARTGEEGVWLALDHGYDAVLLDVLLPGIDGFAVLERLRREGRWSPVLMLTARDAVEDRVQGLDGGADDYLTKPFAFPELLARLRALMRRGARERPAVLSVGDLRLDPATREVSRSGVAIDLTAKEFALLEYLLRHPGQVIPKSRLIEQVWDFAFDSDSNVVEVYIGYLRQKIDRPFGRRSLQTRRGSGYRVVDDGTAAGR